MEFVKDLLLSASLCADCLAVALCSSVNMKSISWRRLLGISIIFAIIHVVFMAVGWLFGEFISRYIMSAVKYIGMGLLVFVGLSMIIDSFKEVKLLCITGLMSVVIAAVADSIDALAAGVSMSMSGRIFGGICVTLTSLFVVTIITVMIGLRAGKVIGVRMGRPASIIGGLVLILLGVDIVADLF